MLLANLVRQGEVSAPQLCNGFHRGLAGAYLQQGAPGVGCPGSFASLPMMLGACSCLRLTTHGCLSHQPFAHPRDSFWCRQDPPAQGTELQCVIPWDKLSFCPCRCCLLGTFSQVSVWSFPTKASPSPHHQHTGHPLPAQTGSSVLMGGRAGINQICGISAEVPAAPNGSAHPQVAAGNQTSQSIPCIPALF